MTLALGASACLQSPTIEPPLNTRVPTRPAATASPRPAPTLFPSLTPPALRNRTPEPTATPAPVVRQLTSGGCCIQPVWSPDGGQVWFVDKPSAVQPGGLWGVPVAGGPPVFITDRLGVFSTDGSLIAYPQAGDTFVERVATGQQWRVPAAGRAIHFSPDNTQIAWQTASSTVNFDRRLVEVWVATVEGAEARSVVRLIGGGLIGWFPDGTRLLVTGRETAEAAPVLAAVEVTTGVIHPLAQVENVRGVLLSPAGGWLAYQIAFSGDPTQDGLWVAMVGSTPRRLPVFGAYRWRAEGRLLVVPLEATGGSHRLVEVDTVTGSQRMLTDPRVTPFRIAAGDWALSPDGTQIVFVSTQDRNLWLLTLPLISP